MKVRVSFEIDIQLKDESEKSFNWNDFTDEIEEAINTWWSEKNVPNEYDYKVLDEDE